MPTIGLMLETLTAYGRAVFTGIRVHCAPILDVELRPALPIAASLPALLAQGVDAIIAYAADAAIEDALRDAGRPVVNVSGLREAPFPRVGVDDHAIGRMAAGFARERLFRHVAFIGNDRAYARRRAEGFAEGMAPAGVVPAWLDVGSGRDPRPMAEFLAAQPHPLLALCLGDEVARTALHACVQARLPVPEQVALLACIDSGEIAERVQPAISAVHLPLERIGAEAAALALRLIAGEAPPAQPVLIEPDCVVERQSTDAEACGDAAVANALRWMRARIDQPIAVEAIARAAGISRRSLERRFRAAVGRSVYNHVLHCRILRARTLLATTRLPLDEIARRTGFSGDHHLCDVFRGALGRTPGSFRGGA